MTDDLSADLISLIAQHLELPDLLRFSMVSSVFRRGCYDRSAVENAISRWRGGKLTCNELQKFLQINRIAAAALAHTHYPKVRHHPRGFYLYEPHVVAVAMHTFGCNERVVSWKPPPCCPPTLPASRAPLQLQRMRQKRRRRAAAHSGRTPYAVCSSLPNAASLASSVAAPSPSSWLSPSGWATPVR